MTETTALVVRATTLHRQGKTIDASTAITTIEFGALQQAFEHLNKTLFDGKLPNVHLGHQRRAHSGGYFAPNRLTYRVGNRQHEHEIALNWDAFIGRTDEWIASILLHEMTHLWQEVFGTPPKPPYHNKQWSQKMMSLGLMPSSTGAVGGKVTGAKMSHYVLPDGPYAQAFAALAATGWKVNLESTPHAGGTKAPASKVKFSCPCCQANAWAKPNSELVCQICLNSLPDLPWIDRDKARDLLELIGRATMLLPRPEPGVAASSNGELVG